MKHFIVLPFLFLVLVLGAIGCSQNSSKDSSAMQNTTLKNEDSSSSETTSSTKKRIVFFGNSLTAAFGLDPQQGFPALIQQKIDALQLDYDVVNAGVSGETSAGGVGRIDWILKQPVSIFVLELGGNDGLRGIDTKSTRQNLQTIIDKVLAKYPQAQIVLAGMLAPPNMGAKFTEEFQRIFPDLAQQNKATLIPFLLKDVAGEPELNLPDGIHPTAEGQKIVANNVWEVLKGML